MAAFDHTYHAAIELPCARHADIVRRATVADAELRPAQVERTTWVEGAVLHIEFRATSRKALRTSVLSFYDFVDISLRALQEFDDDKAQH